MNSLITNEYVVYGMVFLVPYDGSSVSNTALSRAVEHGKAMNEDVVAVTLIPTGTAYAERRKWIEPNEEFAVETARNELKRKIEETTDETERNYEGSSATGPDDGIAKHIRQVANDVGATVLFVGTRTNGSAEGVETPFGSIAQDGSYDVYIVR